MKTPILASLYQIFAALAFIAGIICLFVSLTSPNAIAGGLLISLGSILSGILSLGIAEVILLIAKIEYNTNGSSGAQTKTEKILKESATSLAGLLQATKRTSDLPPLPGHEKYYISIDGAIDGPYKFKDLKELKEKGAIIEDCFYIEERGKTWQKTSEI